MADSYENDGPGGDNPKKRKFDAAAAAGADGGAAMQAAVLAQMQAMQQKMAQMEQQLQEAKKKAKTAAAAAPQVQNFFLTEDERRRVQVRTYRGRVQVDVREWYAKDDGGDRVLLPGKRGLSLRVEEWEKLKEAIPAIDAAIAKLS